MTVHTTEKRVRHLAIVIFLVLFSVTSEGAVYTEDKDAGRLVRLTESAGRFSAGAFFVFEKPSVSKTEKSAILYQCRELNGTGHHTFPAAVIKGYSFFEDVAPYHVSFYALQYFPSGKRPDYIYLCEKLGGSLRSKNMLEMFAFEKEVIRPLASEDPAAEEKMELLFDGKSMELVEEALQTGDLLLAVALFDRFQNFVLRLKRLEQPELYSMAKKKLAENREILRKKCNEHIELSQARKAAFEEACPNIRGRWKEGNPATYKLLQSRCVSARQAYLKASQLSSVTSFPEWGSKMLEVLVLTCGSPEAKELEMQFDKALEAYKENKK